MPSALGLAAKRLTLFLCFLNWVEVLGDTALPAATDTPCLEREAVKKYLWRTGKHEVGGSVPPSKVEGREKQGWLGCTLVLPFPGLEWAVPCCCCSKGVFAPWFGGFPTEAAG